MCPFSASPMVNAFICEEFFTVVACRDQDFSSLLYINASYTYTEVTLN